MKRGLRILESLITLTGMALLAGCAAVVESQMLKNPRLAGMLDHRTSDRSITHTGRLEFIGNADTRIFVLHMYGNPYEMGYQHGKLLRAQVRASIADVMAGCDKFLPKFLRDAWWLTASDKRRIIEGILDRAWAELAPHTPPEDLEEMAGLAAGSGLPLAAIHRVHAIPDLGETSCSALLAKGTTTRDHHIYQLRILDYGSNFHLYRRPVITVYHPPDGHAFINIGWAGFIGVVSGVNDQGVALSEMGFGNPPGETLEGEPMPFLLKNVLRYAGNAEEGAAIVRAAARTNSYIYFLGDPHGNAVGMITSAQQCRTYRANETNELHVGNRNLPQYRDLIYAGHYVDKQGAWVRDHQGQLDLAAIQDLTRQIATKSNLHTVIYDLTAGKFWVANRTEATRAADCQYVEFPLAPAWALHP